MTSLNGVRKRRLTAKETSIANCEVLDEKYRIAVQGVFVVHPEIDRLDNFCQ